MGCAWPQGIEINWLTSHFGSSTSASFLLFAFLFRFLAHGMMLLRFVVVSPLDLLADTDDNEAGNETRTPMISRVFYAIRVPT